MTLNLCERCAHFALPLYVVESQGLLEEHGKARNTSTDGDRPLLLISPALHPHADLRRDQLLFPQTSLSMPQVLMGRGVYPHLEPSLNAAVSGHEIVVAQQPAALS